MPYKVIAKAENFVEDQKFIGHFANVTFQKIGMFMLVKKYCLKLLLNILLESHKSSGGGTKNLAKGCLQKKKNSIWRDIVPTSYYPLPPFKSRDKDRRDIF